MSAPPSSGLMKPNPFSFQRQATPVSFPPRPPPRPRLRLRLSRRRRRGLRLRLSRRAFFSFFSRFSRLGDSLADGLRRFDFSFFFLAGDSLSLWLRRSFFFSFLSFLGDAERLWERPRSEPPMSRSRFRCVAAAVHGDALAWIPLFDSISQSCINIIDCYHIAYL